MSRRCRVSSATTGLDVDIGADGTVTVAGKPFRVTPAGPGRYRVTAEDGTTTVVAVAGPPHALWAFSAGDVTELVVDASPHRRASARRDDTGMAAPMPATVVRVAVAPGDRVGTGAPVVVLEAMKMELTVRASKDGVVRAVHCSVGDLVTPGTALVEIDG